VPPGLRVFLMWSCFAAHGVALPRHLPHPLCRLVAEFELLRTGRPNLRAGSRAGCPFRPFCASETC
jgi:hypothetical protein